MNIRNARHSIAGTIDCEYEHPKFGWIPFTAAPDDIEQIGRDIYDLAVKGPVAPMRQPSKEETDAVAKAQKVAAEIATAKSDTKLSALADMSPTEVRAWVTDNVKTLADARDVLATLAIAVSVITKRI